MCCRNFEAVLLPRRVEDYFIGLLFSSFILCCRVAEEILGSERYPGTQERSPTDVAEDERATSDVHQIIQPHEARQVPAQPVCQIREQVEVSKLSAIT